MTLCHTRLQWCVSMNSHQAENVSHEPTAQTCRREGDNRVQRGEMFETVAVQSVLPKKVTQ